MEFSMFWSTEWEMERDQEGEVGRATEGMNGGRAEE